MYMYVSGYMKCGKLSQFGSSVLSYTDPQWLVTICALLQAQWRQAGSDSSREDPQ